MAHPFSVVTKPIGPKCNLDCQYCFYLKKEKLFDKPSRMMDDEILETWIKHYIESQTKQGLSEVHFLWQGGEPSLCGLDFYEKIVALQEKHRPKHRDVEIFNALQTNGILLTEPWAKFLAEHNFLVGLSLDGTKEMHDTYRVDTRGKGSYDLVVAALKRLQDASVDVNVLAVINNYNANYPVELYQHFVDLGVEHMQFIPAVEPIFHSKNKVDVTRWSVRPKQWGIFLTEACKYWYESNHFKKIHNLLFDIQIGLKLGLTPSLCLFKQHCGDVLALEHNGDMYACDHFVEPQWKIGNILEEDMDVISEKPRQIEFAKMKSGKLPRNCPQCPYLERCWGDCPKNRFVPDTRSDNPRAYLCEGWKYFFKHTDDIFTHIVNEL